MVWSGTPEHYRSRIAQLQAEVQRLEAGLTGRPKTDWANRNGIETKKIQIAQVKEWLEESETRQGGK